MINRNIPILIHLLLNKFEQGDMSLLEQVADDIDLAIEHYQDDLDIQWQRCNDKQGFIEVLTRLSQDVFPKGTKILELGSNSLNDGWHITHMSQTFWYGETSDQVIGKSIIISHETGDQIDYFREIVQSVESAS
jgi:hypothetical protein